MKKKVVAFCTAWTAITLLGASPANAYIYTPVSDTSVQVSNQFQSFSQTICDGQVLNYLQRMKIGGHWMMVATDFAYPSGKYQLTFVATCSDGANVYGVGSCGCLELATSRYESAQPPLMDRSNLRTIGQIVEYRSTFRRDKSDVIPFGHFAAVAAEHRRRGSPLPVVTARI